MDNTQNPFEYNEDEAIKFIRSYLPQELKTNFTDDDINYLIDVIYDFYEEKGFMDDSDTDDDVIEIDEEEMIEYVFKNARKDKVGNFSREDITFVVQGEMKYCESIGIFD